MELLMLLLTPPLASYPLIISSIGVGDVPLCSVEIGLSAERDEEE
jgi:hypothetical protein